MSSQRRFSPPAKKTIYGFLLLSLAMLEIGLLGKANMLDPLAVKRGLGLSMGALMIVVGNYVPKTRPLNSLKLVAADAAAAERFAGWALVLAGGVNVCAFLILPITLARSLSAYSEAILGLGLLLAGLLLWRRARSVEDYRVLAGQSATAGQRGHAESLLVLVSVIWILATALAKYLWNDPHWSRSPAAALFPAAFYVLTMPLLKSSDRGKCTPREKPRERG